MLLVTPSADFFAEPHVDSLIGYAKVFHAAGIRWTLSSHASEAGNFGLFIGNYDQLQQDRAAHPRGGARAGRQAHRRGRVRPRVARRLQLLEHADRHRRRRRRPLRADAAEQLDPRYRQPTHICELTWDLIAARRAQVRQGRQRPPRRHLPRLVQRRARVAHGRRAGRPVRDPARDHPRGRQQVRRDAARHHARSRPSAAAAAAACSPTSCSTCASRARCRAWRRCRRSRTHTASTSWRRSARSARRSSRKVLPYYGFKMSMVGGVHQLVSTAIRLGDQALIGAPGRPTSRQLTGESAMSTTIRPDDREASPSAATRTATRSGAVLAGEDLPGELHAQVPDLHPVARRPARAAARPARTSAAISTSCAASRSRRRACRGRNTRGGA